MSKKKVLLLSHMGQMIAQFNRENIIILQNLGFEVHIAGNFTSQYNTMSLPALKEFQDMVLEQGVQVHQVDFERGIGSVHSNKIVWQQLKTLCEQFRFSLIHCQSPLGGVFGRLLGRKYSVPVIYTAHGFHFYKGGPLKNWILYYPVERFLSKYTDVLITINHTDYQLSEKFASSRQEYIPGVGVDVSSLNQLRKDPKKRSKFGLPERAFVVVSCGELSIRKNEKVIIEALQFVRHDDIYYLVVGKGPEESSLRRLASNLGVESHVIFAGYQADPTTCYEVADIAAFPSRREGLGLAGIEELAAGLPLLTTNNGGISDYSIDGKTGYVISPSDSQGYGRYINFLYENPQVKDQMSLFNRDHVSQFSKENVNARMKSIYSAFA